MRNLTLLFALLLPAVCSAAALRVFVSVVPLQTIVEKVGGAHLEVQAMVRPGHDPHTYAPTPQEITALTKTALYVATGIPFETVWMARIRAVNPEMRVLDARTGIDLRAAEHLDHAYHQANEGHDQVGQVDPHVWTSPPIAKLMARNIRDVLSELDPANRADYDRNYTVFAAELDALDREIKALLEGVTRRSFMVFHPAWGYFADRYGLTQVPIQQAGRKPGARALAGLIEQAKREDLKVVFVQPQFHHRSAEQVARAIGGRVVAIDPLSADYLSNLRRVAEQIVAADRP